MKSIFLTEDIHQCRAVYDETARAQLRGTMTDETVFRKADVPEPPEPGHPFYTLPNCILTPHIAGSLGGEVTRMAACMIQEFERVSAGHPARFEVTPEMLETMA